ncbi:uncharacterized protein BDV17DRAFT_286864 [Aspergillus undulatus]|uniref:uncharacterized protein n=1 Tax=Aspergillus undulatus TaxID=1810928 RepID=UPI003CCE21E3
MSSGIPDELAIPQGVATRLSEDGLIAVAWAGAGLAVLFTGARLAIRLARLKRPLADDYFIILALFFLVFNAVLQTLQAPHLYYVALIPTGDDIAHHAVMYLRFMFAIIGLFWTVLWSVKASLLALFWVMTDSLPHYRRWWWALVAFCIASYAGCWFASGFTCHPPSSFFQFLQCRKPIDRRGSVATIAYSTAVDIFTDLLIMGFSLWIVWSTSVTMRQKVGLFTVFSLGFIIIAFAVLRAINITGKTYTDQAAIAVWGIAESSISVIVGCLPPFKTFLSRRTAIYASRYPLGYGSNGVPYSQGHSVVQATASREPPLEPGYEMPTQAQVSPAKPRGVVSEDRQIRVTRAYSVLRE